MDDTSDRLSKLTAAIQDVTGTDEGTCEWLAVTVFRVLAAMKLESGCKPVPDEAALWRALREADKIVDGDG